MIFQADATKLPAFAGSVNERGGYSIYRIERAVAPAAPDATRLTSVSDRVGGQMGRGLVAAYLASLKAKADVTINHANLEKEGERASPARKPVTPPGSRGSWDRAGDSRG